MSLLLGIWVFSLVAIVALVLYAWSLSEKINFTTEDRVPLYFSDFVVHEISRLYDDYLKLIEHARPHGERTARQGIVLLKRGQEIFIRHVYGRIGEERGRVASFFLKQIKEHQEKDIERGHNERRF